MEIGSNDPEKRIDSFLNEPKTPKGETDSNHFITLAKGAGSNLSNQKLHDVFTELLSQLHSDVSKFKNQYTSLQQGYQQTLAQAKTASQPEQKKLKLNCVGQLNEVIGDLKEQLEKRVIQSLVSTHISDREPSSSLVHDVINTISDPTIKEAYSAKFIKDPETPFLSSAKKNCFFASLIKESNTKMKHFAETVPATPKPPINIQDLENQLSQLATSGPDRNTQALASAVLSEVKILAEKGLSLTTIESWAYAAIVGKMTSNSEYSIGFSNLTPNERGLFKTLTGIDQFQGKFSSHSFTTAQVTEIAKSFSGGTITLQHANDQKFIQAFYTNLQAGQNPKTAADHAYTTVPRSSLSPAMQTFITGIVNPNTPPPFTPHTPTSISDLKNELNQFVSSSDPNVKALATMVMAQVKALADGGVSLTTIESWAYAAIVGKMTEDSKYSTEFENTNSTEQGIFKTLMGIDDFEGKLASHSFSPSDVKAIAKSFSEGTITLKNSYATSFMMDFYTNLNNGQDLKTAAQNAYGKIPTSKLSTAMNVFIQELSNYSPTPPPVYPVPPPTIPTDALPGSVPVVITIPPGKNLDDIYVRIDGPHWCYSLRADGTVGGRGNWTTGNQNMSKYCIKFSDLPHQGNTVTLYLPPVASGRVYFSVGKPLQWAAPSTSNSSDPDNSTRYTMMEFTNNGIGRDVDFDQTAVNGFSSPSASTLCYANQKPYGVPMGLTENPDTFIQNVRNYVKSYVTNPEALAVWEKIFSKIGDHNRITAPKMLLDTFGPYFKPYITNVLTPYIQKHPIYYDINGTQFLMKVSGNNFEYCNYDGNPIATFPISDMNFSNWFSGGGSLSNFENAGLNPTQAAVMLEGLSGSLMSGMKLSELTTSSTNPLSNASFAKYKKEGKFFQATYNGNPMYDVYERAMHAAGYNAYAYDYDDLFGVSQNTDLLLKDKPGFSIRLNW